jgi:hypothetical protein
MRKFCIVTGTFQREGMDFDHVIAAKMADMIRAAA